MLNQFSDDALRELAQDWRLEEIARDVLYAKYGQSSFLDSEHQVGTTERPPRGGRAYYSTDIDELKTAAKNTRSRKKRQQIENKIKRIRRRRRIAAQVEKEKSLNQKLDAI